MGIGHDCIILSTLLDEMIGDYDFILLIDIFEHGREIRDSDVIVLINDITLIDVNTLRKSSSGV